MSARPVIELFGPALNQLVAINDDDDDNYNNNIIISGDISYRLGGGGGGGHSIDVGLFAANTKNKLENKSTREAGENPLFFAVLVVSGAL